jgi:hypothetical protein
MNRSELLQFLRERLGQRNPNSFKRGFILTIIGLIHVLFGFLSLLISVARMLIIGIKEPFLFSQWIGIYNVVFELSPLLLWISGIGILRTKRWGFIIGSFWACLSILFYGLLYVIRKFYWGDFSAPLGWGSWIVIYYSIAFILFSIILSPWKNK